MKVLLVLLPLFVAVYAAYEDRFTDYGVYTIQNRAFNGVLTFANKTDANGTQHWLPPFVYEFDVNNASQRWRIDESGLYKAFELRPLKDENFVLEYNPQTHFLGWLVNWGNKKLWYLMDAGDEHTLIKHRTYDVCLEAMDNHAPLRARRCDGKPPQQWHFQKSPGASAEPMSEKTTTTVAPATTVAPVEENKGSENRIALPTDDKQNSTFGFGVKGVLPEIKANANLGGLSGHLPDFKFNIGRK